jgi:hypothetical protein
MWARRGFDRSLHLSQRRALSPCTEAFGYKLGCVCQALTAMEERQKEGEEALESEVCGVRVEALSGC